MSSQSPEPAPSASDRTSPRRGHGRIMATVKLALLVAVIVFLGRYVLDNIGQLRGEKWTLNPGILALAFALFVGGHAIFVLLWPVLLRRTIGMRMTLKRSLVACAFSWMGRYLPGKVWFVAGKVALTSPGREHHGRVATIVTLETLLVQLAGCLIAGVTLPLLGKTVAWPPGIVWAGFAVLCLSILVGLNPRVLMWLANPILRILEQRPLRLNASYSQMLLWLVIYCMPWLFYGTGAYLTVRAVAPVPLGDVLLCMGAYAAAVVAGFVSLLAPSGIGVREAVFGALLAARFQKPGLVIIVVCLTRLVATAAEAAFFLAALALRRQTSGAGPEA